MFHKLNVYSEVKPVKQKKRMYGIKKREATRSEVEKLIEAKFVREVAYVEWLANPVLVKKSNGKYQMCIDFIDLNQACLKDYCPLPENNKLVNAMVSFEYLSSLDAMSRYYKILMHEVVEEKTSFITKTLSIATGQCHSG